MKILGIGESVIDIALRNGREVSQDLGGPIPIALIFLARMGIDCTMMTTLGKDANGTLIQEQLEGEKISVISQEAKQTKVNRYTIDPANGSRIKMRGTTKHSDIVNLDSTFLHSFDLILIDRHEKKAFYEVLDKKKAATKIMIDPSTEVSSFTKEMITHADYPIIPIEGVLALGQGKAFPECMEILHKMTQQPIIITAGALGSIVSDGETREIIPSLAVRALDVQGAGDVYRGAFAYGITQDWSRTKCCRFANKVAALHCTKVGNAKAIPYPNEVENNDMIIQSIIS